MVYENQNKTASPFEKVGAGWIKTTAKGKMISLQIEIDKVKHNFFMFENKDKKGDKAPDFRITLPPKDRGTGYSTKPAAPIQPAAPAPVQPAAPAQEKAPWES